MLKQAKVQTRHNDSGLFVYLKLAILASNDVIAHEILLTSSANISTFLASSCPSKLIFSVLCAISLVVTDCSSTAAATECAISLDNETSYAELSTSTLAFSATEITNSTASRHSAINWVDDFE